jgi:hypothetical protein
MDWQVKTAGVGTGFEGSISAEGSISGVLWVSVWEFVEVVSVENRSL